MARRGKRRNIHGIDRSWMKHRLCELCDRPYVCNNYQDRKGRIKRWKGIEICATCRYTVLPRVERLIELKRIKIRKKYQ